MLELYKMKKKDPKKRAIAKEERTTLIGRNGKPTPAPSQRKKTQQQKQPPLTLTRMMRYLALTFSSAVITFWVLRRESQVLRWDELHSVLQPEEKEGHRCYDIDRNGNQRCTCPDPEKPQSKKAVKAWMTHHDAMVYDAKKAPNDLDIVFVGDSITERWNGTAALGTKVIDSTKRAFRKRFTKKYGGKLEGIALGSAGDTGPNLLWHLKNGVLEPLDPKAWFIHIGSNDLYTSKCTDRFVIANILNVLKAIQEERPDAQFFLHGILPRKDNPKQNSQFLGRQWHRAQTVNMELKKFCKQYSNIHYLQGGPLFMEESQARGRRKINVELINDGVHPTTKGLEIWGDYIVNKTTAVLLKGEKGTSDASTTEAS